MTHFYSVWETERSQSVATWKEDAACKRLSPEEVNRIFFPSEYTPQSRSEANAFCDRCDVIDKCFSYALVQPSLEGIWAKTTEQERKKLRLRRNKSRFLR